MNYYLIIYQLNGHGESGESCNSQYDLSGACKTCGTGATLVGQLKVKGLSNCTKDLFLTRDGDWLISKGLCNNLNFKTGLEFEQVQNSKKQNLEFWHLNTNKNLPKSSSNSSGFITEDQCKTCQRDGYFNDVEIGNLEEGRTSIIKPLIFAYDEFLELDQDLYQTWEHYGISNKLASANRVIRYARPWLVISERVKIIFDESRVPNISYQKIEINRVQQTI